jgi:hypothetical protein
MNDWIKFDKHILEHRGKGEYRFLGENFKYIGLIYHKPLGAKKALIVGEWINGVKVIFNEPIKNKSDERHR